MDAPYRKSDDGTPVTRVLRLMRGTAVGSDWRVAAVVVRAMADRPTVGELTLPVREVRIRRTELRLVVYLPGAALVPDDRLDAWLEESRTRLEAHLLAAARAQRAQAFVPAAC